jgi:cytochrome c-type biogenesis protein CcmF
MEIGSFVLAWALVPLVLTLVGYFLVAVGAKQYQLSARVTYGVLVGLVGIAFLDLLFLFLGDKFQFSYVSSYSSRDLSNSFPHFFKLSALWAGQQGTFLLWLLYGLLLGLWVRSRAKDNEGWVMFFYILGQVFLIVLALISKPFARLDVIPPDGQGLNPLLQNYWMQIHPPIVFLGFAAACIPFAFAMAALATNRYDDWVKETMPWTVFSVVTLGLGIFLGGYWAYETLGWGGYWSWDPVENASAIPWMVGIALVHGMVVERVRGSWRRLNLFLAILLFLLIVYGTFLTRSGVLADFSVHSFTDLGYNNVLWASIVFLALISLGLWVYRAPKIKGTAPGNAILSQEFTTFLAVALLLPFILLVLFWTSFPLISTAFSKLPLLSNITSAPAAIDTSYYNMAGLIFAAIFSIILGFNSLLYWKDTEPRVFIKRMIAPLIIAIIAALVFIISGYNKIITLWSMPEPASLSLKTGIILIFYFLFFFAALFAFITNIIGLIGRAKGNWKTIGGYLAHIGFAMLLMGIIISSSFGSKTKLSLPQGGAKTALGFSVKFTGTDKNIPKEEKANFDLTQNGTTTKAFSISKEMQRGPETQYVRTPFIKKYLLSDIYLSLENMTDDSQIDMRPFQLKQGENTEIAGNIITFKAFDSNENKSKLAKIQPQIFDVAKGGLLNIGERQIKFEKFDMGMHQQGMASQIGAILDVTYKDKSTTVTPTYEPLTTGEHKSVAVDLPGGGEISLSSIRADIGSISLSYSPLKDSSSIKIGTILNIVSGNDTTNATPIYDSGTAHGEQSVISLPDGGRLFLINVDAVNDSASFILVPTLAPLMATIELSTKPMINLVWFGFIFIVIGSGIATYRRMKDNNSK